MERQHLSQTKNAIAPSQTQSHTIARSSIHPIEELQGAIGNQAVNKLLANQPIVQAKPMFRGLSHELAIQPKLAIGAVGDKYEQEADLIAEQVVDLIHAPQSPEIQREEMPEDDEELSPSPTIQRLAIQRRGETIAGGEASTDLASAINSARGSGQPLDAGLQRSIGQAMGANFSGVKVHTDAQADQLNRSIQAKAFTTGQDVFFRQGAYEPGSRGGQELIAHELTHVVQQNDGAERVQPQAQLQQNGLIQRVVHHGVDPLINYAAGGDQSLLYGLHPSRLQTQVRLGVQDAGMGGGQPIRTIDDYNAGVGINTLMTANMAAVGLFKVRAALTDPHPVANWGNHFAGAAAAVAVNPSLQAWITSLAAHHQDIGLYDFGDRTKVGTFGFRRRVGANLINSKNRFRKNLGNPALGHANNITPKEINSFLRPNRTFNQALTVFTAMPPAKQAALNQWVYKAFFRRTSKLGIDFAINDLNARINFNTGAAIDHTSADAQTARQRVKGLEQANLLMDQDENRAITISELRHIKKGLRNATIAPGDVNFYDEY